MTGNPELRSAKGSKHVGIAVAALGIAAAVLALAALFLFGDDVADYARESLRDRAPTETAGRTAGLSADRPAGATQQEEKAPAGSAPDPAPAEECGPDTPARECGSRNEIIDRLRTWRAETMPALAELSSVPWAAPALREIEALEKRSVAAYGEGKYAAALGHLKDAEAAAGALLDAAADRFAADLAAAIAAFSAAEPERARKRIDDALLIRPGHPVARGWRDRIAVLPEFLEVMAGVEKARAENDRRAEKVFLERAVRLDPARKELRSRLRKLSREIVEREFAAHIARGSRAVGDRKPEDARRELAAARKLSAGRPEVAILERDLRVLESGLARDKHLARARSAAAADDWKAARDAFGKARSADDGNTEAVTGEVLARRILDARAAIEPYLSQPERLASTEVAAAARAVLDGMDGELAAKSPGLARMAAALEAGLRDAAVDVPVRIISDNQTEIAVHGVGTVGKTLDRTISLRPGTYVFEGRRAGYRSKLLTVEIAVGAASREVTLICDDRI